MGHPPVKKCGECEYWEGKSGHIGFCKLYKKFVWEFGDCITVKGDITRIFEEIEEKQKIVDDARLQIAELFRSLPFDKASEDKELVMVLHSAVLATIFSGRNLVKILSSYSIVSDTEITEYTLVEFEGPTLLATESKLFFFQKGQKCAFVIHRMRTDPPIATDARVLSNMAVLHELPENFCAERAEELNPFVYYIKIRKVKEDESAD